MNEIIWILVSVIIVSLISVFSAIPLLAKKKISNKLLVFLMSLSVGTLLGGVFIHFMPEITEHGYSIKSAMYIIAGFVVFFLLEKFVHYHHNKKCEEHDYGHGHAYHLAPLNLIGDGIHNALDGLVLAGAYFVSIEIGIAATISVIFHEIPQEIADFGILLYSGLSRIKALFFNFLSATTAIIGAIIGIFLAGATENFSHFIIPFAAGNFIYIAASNLVPELHRHCKLIDTLLHLLAISLGVFVMYLITIIGPAHIH
ncbi:MAG: ZIP family metal transporter [Nanoarchaeota archaeon]|nr:ZIP family metal transporter [Nanoarchaeota archaeon]